MSKQQNRQRNEERRSGEAFYNTPSGKLVARKMWEVFNSCAPDMLTELDSIPRDEAIEVVLDADRLELYCRNDKERELIREFRALGWWAQVAFGHKVFTHTRYVL